MRQPVSRFESDALARTESESDRAAERNATGARSSGEPRSWCCTAASTTHTGGSRNICNDDRTWGAANAGVLRPRPVAYFSAEFGLHESLPIYSGGLGVLAGDHIKSASDLDIPLIGVGLFYGQGYFLQRLDETGWQREEYLETDVNQLPMQPAIGVNGEPVVVEIATRSGSIRAKVWRVKVGRCDLLLLDSNVARKCA